MEKLSKKELKEKYINRERIGGVYCIKCSGNDRTWIKATKDMDSAKKRFEFSAITDLCPQSSMSEEWKVYGGKSFSFEVLEEIKKGETQTEHEFQNDIDTLLEIWTQKQN